MQQFSTQTYHEMRHWIHSMMISKGKAIIYTIIITTDTFRSAYITYTNDEYVNGLLSYRYVFAKQELNTSTMDPGFYPNGPSGLFNLSAVQPFSNYIINSNDKYSIAIL